MLRIGRLLAALVSGVVATLTLGTLPVFVARISQAFELDIGQAGILASADLGGCAIGCMIALVIQRKLRWALVLHVAIIVSTLGNILSITSADYVAILLSRGVAGLGNGCIVSLVFSALCASQKPDRNFGLYTFGQLIAQALFIPLFTYLVARFEVDALFVFLALANASLVFLVRWFPTHRGAIDGADAPMPVHGNPHISLSRARSLPIGMIVPMTGLAVYFLSFSAVWAYFEAIGQAVELSVPRIGGALGAASIVGILGPLTVIFLPPGFGRTWLLVLGTFVHIASVIVLLGANGYWPFLIGASVFIYSLNFVFPFQMGALAQFDSDGRVAVLALVVQLLCLAVGPIVGARLFGQYGLSVMLICAIVGFVVSVGLFVFGSFMRSNRERVA